MSGARNDVYPVQRHAATHPDLQLVTRFVQSLQWWLAQPYEADPTSALTGGGAIRACEREFSCLHDGRPALLLPSGTYALRAALDVLGVGQGNEVVIPALDWTATYDAVVSVGATPVPVAVDRNTLTLSPDAASAARTSRTRAVVVCHLHGVAGDVSALRDALPGVPVVEDCAAAFGSTLDGNPVGTLGDLAVLSLGPGKTIDAGEGGVLLSADVGLHRAAVARTGHALRQNLTGLDAEMSLGNLSIRPNIVTAITALYELSQWDGDAAVRSHQMLAESLASAGRIVPGLNGRRTNAQRSVATLREPSTESRCFGSVTGAANLAPAGSALRVEIEQLRRCVSLVPVPVAGPNPENPRPTNLEVQTASVRGLR